MSRIGFARTVGIDLLPACSIQVESSAKADNIRSRSKAKSLFQDGSCRGREPDLLFAESRCDRCEANFF